MAADLQSIHRPKWANMVHSSAASMHNQQRWMFMFCALWVLMSVYPMFLYFRPGSTYIQQLVSSSHATATETIAVPAVAATPIPNAIVMGQNGVEMAKAEMDKLRIPDVTDGFHDFKKHKSCNFSSLDLHSPFSPLCTDRESLLIAMSSGGRIGRDAPYAPRGCDMRWFNVQEMCEILSRFKEIFVVGDSMMRNLAAGFHVLIRADLYNGGRTKWTEQPRGSDCRCGGVFNEETKCAFNAAFSSKLIWKEDPNTMACPRYGPAAVEFNPVLDYPIQEKSLDLMTKHITVEKPEKPYAFIFGHGIWNDLNTTASELWIEKVTDAITSKAPYLQGEHAVFPRLFMTPNAAGVKKPDTFIASQGNIALARFEEAMAVWVKQKGLDHLGTFNATIQSSKPDGTHGGMKNAILKAMMVLNWLNAVDTSLF